MGVLLAWVVGYVVGARAGSKDFDEVVQAVRELRESEEMQGLWDALRSHLAHTLRSTADMVERGEAPSTAGAMDLVDRVRLLMRRDRNEGED
jgi:hypothetical protein